MKCQAIRRDALRMELETVHETLARRRHKVSYILKKLEHRFLCV